MFLVLNWHFYPSIFSVITSIFHPPADGRKSNIPGILIATIPLIFIQKHSQFPALAEVSFSFRGTVSASSVPTDGPRDYFIQQHIKYSARAQPVSSVRPSALMPPPTEELCDHKPQRMHNASTRRIGNVTPIAIEMRGRNIIELAQHTQLRAREKEK